MKLQLKCIGAAVSCCCCFSLLKVILHHKLQHINSFKLSQMNLQLLAGYIDELVKQGGAEVNRRPTLGPMVY